MSGAPARAEKLRWRGLLAGRDLPPLLQAHARFGRLAALAFVAFLLSWLVCIVGPVALDAQAAFACAIGMMFSNGVCSYAFVLLTVRAGRLLADRACFGCAYSNVRVDSTSPSESVRAAFCPECGRLVEEPERSIALREALPRLRKGGGRLASIVALLGVGVALSGAAVVVLPPSAIPPERASPLGLGLIACGMGMPMTFTTLRIMLAARSSPRAE